MNNPDALARYITENDANILHCTPSRLLAYLEEPSFREAMRGVDVVPRCRRGVYPAAAGCIAQGNFCTLV